jgi:predicted HicB family RNase H-like nuclease
MTKNPHGLTGQKNALKGPVPRSVRMSVRVPPDLDAAIREMAAAAEVTASDVVVAVLCDALMRDVSPR